MSPNIFSSSCLSIFSNWNVLKYRKTLIQIWMYNLKYTFSWRLILKSTYISKYADRYVLEFLEVYRSVIHKSSPLWLAKKDLTTPSINIFSHNIRDCIFFAQQKPVAIWKMTADYHIRALWEVNTGFPKAPEKDSLIMLKNIAKKFLTITGRMIIPILHALKHPFL